VSVLVRRSCWIPPPAGAAPARFVPLPKWLAYHRGVTFIFGVDLDGVCGHYTAALAPVVAAHQGRTAAELGEPNSWDFSDWGLDRAQFELLHRRAVLDHRIFNTMPVMPGAPDVLWRLSDAGIWIRVISHRLAVNWGHAIAVSDTVEWLDRVGIPYRDLCFLGDKPQVEADLYIDDAPHNVEALREQGNDVIVFDAPYNRHLDGPRAHDWGEVEHLVIEAASLAGLPMQTQMQGVVRPDERLDARLGRAPRRSR
jgi:5'-nucleotidase